ncbi:MAG: TetR/AcrR family transcriptional regulator [Microbacterium sp.]|uniref:TetR/AcrR family transcriptional regulator n=1 Tax=Microbacterium sp. TaxID=51671 RepID=UPI002625A0B4|nr:TetR/AcrR family transcriptional regulator [Microbacterium sp.]MCX6502664.1 TetR/AcrR family transcriptional regulator [Microbacterium sp.]
MDPRAARTQARLQDALLALARERPLDEITVGDITERAEVNRSSFYQHYSDKETLLADALERMVDEVSGQLLARGTPAPAGMPEELAHYLQHLADNAPLYRRVLGEHGSAVVAARLRRRVEGIVTVAVGADSAAFVGLPVDVVAAGIAGTALGVITAWISRDPLPPVDVAAEWLWRVLTGPGALAEAEARA